MARRTEHCWPVITGPADWESVMLDPASTEVGSSHRIERLMTEQTHRQFVLEQAKRFKAAGWTVLYAVHTYRRSVDVVRGLIADALAAGVEPVVFQEDPLMEDTKKARWAEYASEDFCFPGQGMDELYDDAGYVVATNSRALQGKVEKALEQLGSCSEGSVKLLVIEEAALLKKKGIAALDHIARLTLPVPTKTLEPVPCPYCGAELNVYASQTNGLLYQCQRRVQHRKNGHPDHYGASATINIVSGGEKRDPSTQQRNPKLWSQAESDKARQLRSQGLSYTAIGKGLGRSLESVRFHLSRGGYEGTLQRQSTRAYLRERIAAIDAANAVGRNL